MTASKGARRALVLVWLAPALAAIGCGDVLTLETAVPSGTEVFEPRLLGNWEVREGSGSDLKDRVVVTQEGAKLYLIRIMPTNGDSAVVYSGRLGPLGARRWILEFSPVADTLRYTHTTALFSSDARHSRDSSRTAPPSLPLMIAVHMHLVVERADSGLRLAWFNGDSLQAALESRRLTTPYTKTHESFEALLLTETDSRRLNAALARFADRPGALVWLPRVGYRVAVPQGP